MSFRHRVKLCFLTLLAFSLFLSNIQAQTSLPQGVVKVTSVEGLTEYRLANGLRVVLFPDATKTNITVNIVYLVGSKHENYGETGMAHLLEHLVFKGTPKHPNIPAELTARGAAPNGTTWYDRTNYFETFAATDENLDWALDLEADRMINSFISKKDLESEFSVVRNEMESGENNPFRILSERVTAAAYQWHNYGKTTIGARSDIENVPIERLQAFYKTWYQPDNAVLIVAGKIDEMKTLNLIQKKFGAIPKPTRELPKFYTSEPVQDGERTVTVRRVGDTQIVMAGYHTAPGSHPDFPAVAIMNRLLADEPSGKLYKNLVETKKATSVFASAYQNRDPGYVIFGAELDKTASIDTARDALLETIESFAKTAPSKEEVERFKTALMKNIDLSLNDPNGMAIQLTNWVAQGDWRLFFLYRDRLKKVTPEDVQRVAKNYLKQQNRTLGMFIPTAQPDRAQIPQVSDNDLLAMVTDYKGDAVVSQGEVFDPTPANLEGRVKRTTLNGLKVAFLPKKNRGDAVFLRVNLRFGDAKSLMNRSIAGNFAGQMLMRGANGWSRQEIKDLLDKFKARGFVAGSATGAFASMETTDGNLQDVIKVVAHILRKPDFPQAEFDQLKQEALTALENERSEPQSVALRAMSSHFNRYPKGDVRYAMTLDEEIAAVKALTLDDVKKFHADFYGASNGEIVVVGGESDKTGTFGTFFAGWSSKAKYERIPSEYNDIPAQNKSFETPDKQNAFFTARLNVKMRDDNADYPAFTLGNFMLGGGFLNSRLATRIRQKEGISYGVGSNFGASSVDEYGTFNAFAIYAPQNAAKLEAAFKEEIQKVITDGFTAEEFEQAKQGWLLSRQRNRGNDGGLAQVLGNYLFINRTFAWDGELEKKVQALTVAEVNAAMKKYLTPDKISIFKAGDFANADKIQAKE